MDKNKVKEKNLSKSMLIIEIFTLGVLFSALLWVIYEFIVMCIVHGYDVLLFPFFLFETGTHYWLVSILISLCLLYRMFKGKKVTKFMWIIEIFALIILVSILYVVVRIIILLIQMKGTKFTGLIPISLFNMCIVNWPVSILAILCLLYQDYLITHYKKRKEKSRKGKLIKKFELICMEKNVPKSMLIIEIFYINHFDSYFTLGNI